MKNYLLVIFFIFSKITMNTMFAQGIKPDASLGVGYTNNQIHGYWGSDSKVHLATAIKLTSQMMNGTQIIALKCVISSTEKITDCKLFVKKNIVRDENIYEQEFVPVFGWNYIYLDHPLDISELDELYIGYEITSIGEFIGYEKTSESRGDADWIRSDNGEWTHLSKLLQTNVAHCMTAILTGGDYESYEQTGADIQNDVMPSVVKADAAFNLKGTLINRGVRILKELNVSYKINGGEEKTTSLKVDLSHLETHSFSFPLELPQGKNTLSVWLSDVDGVSGKNFFAKTYLVEAFQKAFPHTMLIEYFTGQGCAYCPVGKVKLDKAIKRYEDQTALIMHHAGFSNDIFTISESLELAKLWNINSAPNMILERSKTNIDNNMMMVFHPSYITADMIGSRTVDAALVGIQLENSFYKGDSVLVIKAHVEKDRTFSETARLHVYLSENGYVANQAGGMENYVHNHFPRNVLSALEGDILSYDQDGCCEVTYSYKIPAKYRVYDSKNTISSHPDKMEIVAFVSEFDPDSNNYSVYNAATQTLNFTDGTGGIQIINENTIHSIAISYNESGEVIINGEYCTASIYNTSGTCIKQFKFGKGDNLVRLPAGVYIIRAITNSQIFSQKFVVE